MGLRPGRKKSSKSWTNSPYQPAQLQGSFCGQKILSGQQKVPCFSLRMSHGECYSVTHTVPDSILGHTQSPITKAYPKYPKPMVLDSDQLVFYPSSLTVCVTYCFNLSTPRYLHLKVRIIIAISYGWVVFLRTK